MILIGFNGKMALTRHRFQVLFTLHVCILLKKRVWLAHLFEAEIHFLNNNLLMGQFFKANIYRNMPNYRGRGNNFDIFPGPNQEENIFFFFKFYHFYNSCHIFEWKEIPCAEIQKIWGNVIIKHIVNKFA